MGMNRSNGQMYEFVSHTWNPIKGECFHDCAYCYMKTIDHIFHRVGLIRLATDECRTNLGKGNFVFVGSSTDMWARNIPDQWIVQVLDYCEKFDNRYLWQSKDPSRFVQFVEHPVMRKSFLCTTLETDEWLPDIMNNSPHPEQRVKAMAQLASMGAPIYITIEPIMKFNLNHFVSMIRATNPIQVNIGRAKAQYHLPEPSEDDVQALITELSTFTKVHVKSNASTYWNLQIP
ncbi:MAG: DUF5131 family protein [Bacteroidaceae bacterium]|nr:DUF5131 family protein [Bacteroidaceae bacterium]